MPAPGRYTSSEFGFSVEYPSYAAPAAEDDQSVQWAGNDQSGSGPWGIELLGEMANGRAPQQVVDALQQRMFTGATLVFSIPGAEIGYTDGYGGVYDIVVSPQGGQQQHERALIEAAIRDGVAVDLVAFSNFTPDQNPHPIPAQLAPPIELYADVFGNSVTWQGEPQL